VQPYAEIELVREAGIERSYEERLRWNDLHRLHVVWNIDKHRRLVDLTWRPEPRLVGIIGAVATGHAPWRWHPRRRLDPLPDQRARRRRQPELNSEFNLTFPDDPATAGADGAKDDVLAILEGWHGRNGGYVFPRVFTPMSQRPER
jgi:hypothetical protein